MLKNAYNKLLGSDSIGLNQNWLTKSCWVKFLSCLPWIFTLPTLVFAETSTANRKSDSSPWVAVIVKASWKEASSCGAAVLSSAKILRNLAPSLWLRIQAVTSYSRDFVHMQDVQCWHILSMENSLGLPRMPRTHLVKQPAVTGYSCYCGPQCLKYEVGHMDIHTGWAKQDFLH